MIIVWSKYHRKKIWRGTPPKKSFAEQLIAKCQDQKRGEAAEKHGLQAKQCRHVRSDTLILVIQVVIIYDFMIQFWNFQKPKTWVFELDLKYSNQCQASQTKCKDTLCVEELKNTPFERYKDTG